MLWFRMLEMPQRPDVTQVVCPRCFGRGVLWCDGELVRPDRPGGLVRGCETCNGHGRVTMGQPYYPRR